MAPLVNMEAQERRLAPLEGLPGFFFEPLIQLALLFVIRKVSPILYLQFKPRVTMHKLQWLAESVSIKRCTQHLVASGHLIERQLQPLRMEGQPQVKAADVDAVI